ncbi:MAG: DUF4258 domain-containing protein [Rhizobacter sp.]|nr:DUF4258 domain-containing protein [Ferruginibacter sp.]
MNKNYIPIIALLAAALFFYWIKSKQRGSNTNKQHRVETRAVAGEFNRNASEMIYSKHARCRMDCRHIDEGEVKEILAGGQVNESRIETSSKGTSYPLEGTTHDGQKVRIVFAPKENGKMIVVTVIDLEKEYECECD